MKCTSAEEGGASPLFQPCAHTCAKSRIRGTRERSRMYAPPPPLEETFWFRVIRVTWPSKGRKKRVNVDESKKKKKLALRLCRRCQAHTHTLFSFFFFEKIEPHSSSTFSPWEVGSPNKKHEAPRAAASLAAGLVERRRRACCGSSNSSRGRISNSSSNMRRRRERELAFCFFFCSASRGDQVRVLAFFVLLVSPLESLRLALSVARAFFAKLVRVAARERGRGIRQMLRFSFSTTPSAFFFFPFVCFARPSTSQALSLPPNVSPSLSLLETRLEELLLSIAARMSD